MATIVRENVGHERPFNSVEDEITGVGGVESEFLFEGTATEYRLAGGRAEYPVDGRWDAEPNREAQFRSRMLVLRPDDPAAFNGTVIVHWNNVSMGEDRFNRAGQARNVIADGYAIVGVTTQLVGLLGRPARVVPDEEKGREGTHRSAGTLGLLKQDPERYGTLEHPGDGFSYDIFSQAGRLLGPDRAGSIDPLGGLAVRNLLASGGSQAGSRMATYRNAVHPVASVFDAFLIAVYGGCPTALDPSTAPDSILQIGGGNPVQLLEWRKYLLRDDLSVPTIVLQSETEAALTQPNFQPDTDTLRFWEFAGAGHRGLWPPAWMESTEYMREANQVSFWPAYRASLSALRRWLDEGVAPPHQPRLERVGDPPTFPRDEHGNATGGIRLPELEVPLGTYVGESPTEANVQINGQSTLFPPERVRALYPDRETWFAGYKAAVERLVAAQVYLPDDAATVLEHASRTPLPL